MEFWEICELKLKKKIAVFKILKEMKTDIQSKTQKHGVKNIAKVNMLPVRVFW